MFGIEKTLKCDIYIGSPFDTENPPEKLDLRTEADCVPYYPYIISVQVFNKIYLTRESWVQIQEQRYGHLPMFAYYRKALLNELKKFEREVR